MQPAETGYVHPVPEETTERRVVADRYLLCSVRGRGGMGTVWEAEDQLLERRVAVKEVPLRDRGALGDEGTLRQRVLREARVAARVSHPSLVSIYDVVDGGDRVFLVQEYVDAPTLTDVVAAQGPLDQEAAAAVGRQVLGALVALHAAGVVHRDVKPSNVLVTPGGVVKVADFGIALMEGDADLTLAGSVLGSPGYLAPEQASGQRADAAADLWALGATLWFAVEGRGPYGDAPGLAALGEVVHGPVPVAEHAGALGPVIETCMRKDPEQRADPAELERLLERVSAGQPAATVAAIVAAPLSVPPPPPPPAPVAAAVPVPAPAPVPAPPPPPPPVAPEPQPVAAEPEPAAPAARRPPEPPPAGGAPGDRSSTSPWLLGIAAAVVLIALIAAGLALAGGDDAATTAPPTTAATATTGGGGAATAATSTEPRPAPTTTARPQAAATTAAPQSAEVPAEWVRHTDAKAGYTIAHPPTWQVKRLEDNRTDITDPQTGAYLRVDWTDEPADPLEAWQRSSKAFGQRYGGYEELRLERTEFQGYPGAIWEYRYSVGNARLHASNLTFVTSKDRAYALNFQTSDARWDESQVLRRQLESSFQVVPKKSDDD